MPDRSQLALAIALCLAGCAGDDEPSTVAMAGSGGQPVMPQGGAGAGGVGGISAGAGGTQAGTAGNAGAGGTSGDGGNGGATSDAGIDRDAANDGAAEDGDGGPAEEHWVTTWGTSLIDLGLLSMPLSDGITLRQVVHASAGGERLRVRLSNRFGTTPLVIAAAHVALRDSGSSIVAASDRALAFEGQASITIPAGEERTSDPVALSVAAFADLAVSLELPGSVLAQTVHSTAIETAYATDAEGAAGEATLSVASTYVSWLFIEAVDVEAAPEQRAIVAFGDSITDGYMGTDGANKRWPDELARRLAAADLPFAVVNEGFSGNQVLADYAGESALKRFERDVLGNAGVSHVIVLEGINDIGMSGATADAIIGGYEQLIAKAHAAGLKIIFGTICPFEGALYYSEPGEAARTAVNEWIRSHGDLFDGMVDFDAAVRDPSATKQLSAAYDSGDFLHPSDAGYVAMGQAVDLALFE